MSGHYRGGMAPNMPQWLLCCSPARTRRAESIVGVSCVLFGPAGLLPAAFALALRLAPVPSLRRGAIGYGSSARWRRWRKRWAPPGTRPRAAEDLARGLVDDGKDHPRDRASERPVEQLAELLCHFRRVVLEDAAAPSAQHDSVEPLGREERQQPVHPPSPGLPDGHGASGRRPLARHTKVRGRRGDDPDHVGGIQRSPVLSLEDGHGRTHYHVVRIHAASLFLVVRIKGLDLGLPQAVVQTGHSCQRLLLRIGPPEEAAAGILRRGKVQDAGPQALTDEGLCHLEGAPTDHAHVPPGGHGRRQLRKRRARGVQPRGLQRLVKRQGHFLAGLVYVEPPPAACHSVLRDLLVLAL
mmetsp:Transcript_38108/g.106058  ORF Transcript_38108/g.106058 Transcript_38108/m.106058 type:complete len:354 (+) Transcript_38108:156-1217(+)